MNPNSPILPPNHSPERREVTFVPSRRSSSKTHSTPPPHKPYRPNQGYRLGRRRFLYERRRTVSDFCLVFAMLGLTLMVVDVELRMAPICSRDSIYSIGLRSVILVSTVILLGLIIAYHLLQIQLYIIDNCIEDWRIAISTSFLFRLGLELLVCSIHPLPTYNWATVNSEDEFVEAEIYANDTRLFADSPTNDLEEIHPPTLQPTDLLFSLPMFFRLYLISRTMMLHSRLFSDASSRSIGALNRINFNTRFIVKTLMTICPGTVLLVFMLSLWLVTSWMLRVCESNSKTGLRNFLNAMWLTSITFLTVGYGDFVPSTHCGRGIAVCTGVMGAGVTALVVAVLAKKLELTRAEMHVHNFMMDTQLTKMLKNTAANVLRETWLIYKNTKLARKINAPKLRKHQRKFLRAIHGLRRVKLEQRKLKESANTLIDIAKVQCSLHEVILEMSARHHHLEERLRTVEELVLKIQNELDALPARIAEQIISNTNIVALSNKPVARIL